MTAYILLAGTLFFRTPERRISKAGKPFATATIRANDGDSSQRWKVLAFSGTAQAELNAPYRRRRAIRSRRIQGRDLRKGRCY